MKEPMVKLGVNWVECCAQYWAALICVKDLLTIHLLLDLLWSSVYFPCIQDDLFLLLWGRLGCSVHTAELLKLIAMLGNSQWCIEMNPYVWNIINSILPCRSYINSANILLPSILITLHTFIFLTTFQMLFYMINSWAYLMWMCLRGIALAGLTMCCASSFPETTLDHTKNDSIVCPGLDA